MKTQKYLREGYYHRINEEVIFEQCFSTLQLSQKL